MPKLTIQKSKTISASPEKVYEIISDFHHWRPWSPWLIQEAAATVDIAPDGKSYSWSGKIVGDGEMEVAEETPHKAISYNLTFLKPWKSKAKISFHLIPQGDHTVVQWGMDSSLPFFLFYMKKMMTNIIGMDYDRGLTMLKQYVEKGKVNSKVEVEGETTFAGCTYIALRKDCSVDTMPKEMSSDIEKLFKFANEHSLEMTAPVFTAYEKWDFNKNRTTYLTGLQLKEIPEGMDVSAFVTGTFPEMKTHLIKHTGEYNHLGNAWSAGMSLVQKKMIKASKQYKPFELYISDPRDTPAEQIVTEIHFPLK